MPAQSKQQQKLFGLALSVKRGDTPRSEVSDDVLGIVDKMSEKEIEDFASTDHKGLPTKKEEIEEIIREKIREMLNPIMKEGRAFVQAAKKAQQEGKTEFEFNGKTYPITLKEEVITEMSDKEFVGDQLVNGVGDGILSRNEFIKVISKQTNFDKIKLGKVYDVYLKLDGRQRVKLDITRNMNRFLDKLGITESVNERKAWTPRQTKGVLTVDKHFNSLLAKKGIEPYSPEAYQLWIKGGFPFKMKKVFEKDESINEINYIDKTDMKDSVLRSNKVATLIDLKLFRWAISNSVRFYKGIGQNYMFTDGIMSLGINLNKPYTIVKNWGKVDNKLKQKYIKDIRENIENGDTMEREIVNEAMVKIEVDMFKQFNQRKPDKTMPMKIDSKTPLSKLLNHTTFKAMKQKYDYIELHYGDKFLGSAMAGTDNWEFKKGRGLKDTSFRESVNENNIIKEETFTAINKDTGKVSVFKSKDSRDAAIKAGTHEKRDEKGSEDKNKSGTSVSGKNMFKHASDIKKQSGDTGDGGGEDSDTKKSDTSSDDSPKFTSIGNDKYKLKGQENDQSADAYTKDEIDLINKDPDAFNQYKPLGNGKYKHEFGFISTKDEVIQRLSKLAILKSKDKESQIRQRSGGERQQSSQNSKKMKLNKGTLKTGGQTRTEPGTYMNPDTREWFVVVKGGGYLGPYKSSGEAEDAQVKYSSLDYSQQQALRGESINEASGNFVVYVEKDNGRKKLLHTKKSQRAANMFMSKNMDKILNKSGIRSIGSMSQDQWEKKEARFAENIKKSDMKTVTKKEWDRTHKDFKGMIKGQPYMMWYDKQTHTTVYGPVYIKDKEVRQLKDPKKEMMVAKKGKVKVIDKKDWNKYKSKGYIVAENKKAEELWSQTIDMFDKNLSKGYDPSKIRNVNLIAGTLQKLFKGLPQRNAIDMATSYNDYKSGQKDKKQTVKDWVRILKKHQIKEASLSVIHKAAKKGSYPVTVMAIDTKKRKVVKQELVKTPMAVPAAFMMMQGGYPEASIAVEDAKGQIIYKEKSLK